MKRFLLSIAVAVIAGCSTSGSIYRESTPPSLSIPMASFDVEIVDKRTDVATRPIVVPTISAPWDEDSVSPPLPTSLHARASGILSAARITGEKHLDFEIEVVEARQHFLANVWSETERINWTIRLMVVAGSSRTEYLGEADGHRSSMDASSARLDSMFLSGFSSALTDALSKYEAALGTIGRASTSAAPPRP